MTVAAIMANMTSSFGWGSLQTELGFRHMQRLRDRIGGLFVVLDDPAQCRNAVELCDEALCGLRDFIATCENEGMPSVHGFAEEVFLFRMDFAADD